MTEEHLSDAGKYRPGFDEEDPKRWKANFRCALNSLSDVKEVPSLSRKNGSDGYTVYQFTTTAAQGHSPVIITTTIIIWSGSMGLLVAIWT